MQEIRLRWSKGIERDPLDPVERTQGAGLWFPDTPENRAMVESVRSVAEATFGEGTHWIEERQA